MRLKRLGFCRGLSFGDSVLGWRGGAKALVFGRHVVNCNEYLVAFDDENDGYLLKDVDI